MLLMNILSKPGVFFVLRREDCWKHQMYILLSNNLRRHNERSVNMILLHDLEVTDIHPFFGMQENIRKSI